MFLDVYRVRENVKLPERANPSDAGADVFYNPDEKAKDFGVKGNCSVDERGNILLFSEGNAIIPAGIKVGVPHGFALIVFNRGSMGAKKCLDVGACVIDSGYNNEIFIDLHNIGSKEQTIKPGDKIAQLLLLPCVHFRVKELDKDELYDYPIAMSERGEGNLGSTDKK